MITLSQRVQEITDYTVGSKPKIGLDTNCVQYYLNSPPVQPWADCLDLVFQAGLDGRVELYVSTVVVSELLSHAHYAARDRAGYDPELDLMAIIERHFQILDVNRDIAKMAGRLRGNYVPGDKICIKTPDALIGGTSLADGHTLFVTNDAQLANALPSDRCIYLRDLALDWLDQNFLKRCVPDMTAVPMRRRGAGMLDGVAFGSLELGSLRPKASARWDRLLAEAFYTAAALNEPCAFFLLNTVTKKGENTEEVLFWHEALGERRPVWKIIRRLREHLGYRPKSGTAARADSRVHVFYFTSRTRERARQSQPAYAAKTYQQQEYDAWQAYLGLFWYFKDVMALPETQCLLCENGVARRLDSISTLNFISEAKNVLGWKDA